MGKSEFRSLTDEERDLLVWLLGNGPDGTENYLPQVDVLQARNSCSCGCPSIEFTVPIEEPMVDSPRAMRIFFDGQSGDDAVGLMLISGNGTLSELEIYTHGGVDHAFGLPPIGTLVLRID